MSKYDLHLGGDAGHAGFGVTKGKRPPDGSFYEWDFNNKVMVLIEQKLSRYENTKFTRLDDRTGKRDVPLAERTAKARNAGVDATVSMHANAYGSGGWNDASGIETFVSADGLPSNEITLAANIQNHLIRDLGRKNRGVKKGNLYMTKVSSKIPSVLVEAGFMTNREEAVLLMSTSYQEKVAEAVIKGLVSTYKLKPKQVSKPITESSSEKKAFKGVKIISDKYGIYKEMGVYKEPSTKYLNWTLVANKEVTYKGQKWYHLISGKDIIGWIASDLVHVFPENNYKNVREATKGYKYDLNTEIMQLEKGDKVMVLEELKDSFLVLAYSTAMYISKKIVD